MENISSTKVKKLINIQVNEETPMLIKLDINANLKELRVLLSKNEIQMNDNMNFLRFSARIPKSEESEFLLSEIIFDDNLRIKDMLDWKKIIENNRLEYGLHFTETGPVEAKEKAFNILRYTQKNLPLSPYFNEVVKCQTEIENLYIKNYIATTTNLNEKLPGLPTSSKYEKNPNKKIETVYHKIKRGKAILILDVSDLKPTKQFVSAVDKALESNNKLALLKKIADDFGYFWCKRLEIGGIIIYEETNETGSTNIPTLQPVGIGVPAGENGNLEASNNSFKLLVVHGGLEKYYHEQGIAGWIKSLNDYRNWKIAEFSEIRSIFDILDDERRLKVSEALGKQILVSQVVELNITFDLSKRKPFMYEFPRNFRFSNTDQIFVTGMSDENSKAVFATRLHYVDDRSQPVILLHRLGKLKDKSTLKDFSLKLGYIVVGISTLNLFEQTTKKLVLESETVSFNNNHYSVITKNQERDINTSLISTCVSKSKNLQNNPKSEFIMGAHFGYRDNEFSACTYCYDQKMRPIYQFDKSDFFVNYSLISGQQNNRFGQAQITKKNFGLRLLPSKKSKITFEKYPQIVSTQALRSPQPTLQSPVFISLILDNCPEKCVHGFFKIAPEYAVFQSLNNPITKNHRVAYFSVNTD
ncbi:4424_t:CDS:2 [Ambispora gerdemannii]|uniref:4424_t:CDS:1 n=1 Tax=Ambispora gerdemannii TaxID=144530 RepID=A0A9N9B3V1_9GLOM|nr:4424_t:CDS:2 [Ambispora gerdemannii]